MKKYDFAVNWNSKDDCYFAKLLRTICRKNNISFLWIYDGNVKDILKKLHKGQLLVDVLLDTDATYEDPEDLFAKICYAVKDNGGIVINDPDRTQYAIDKSKMYYEVKRAGISTPYTYVVRNWREQSFTVDRMLSKRLGMPFVIKPGLGYAQKGVVRFATGSSYGIKKARKFDPKDNYLLQKRVTALVLGGKKAWFRVFYVFGRIILCWWDDVTNKYEHVSEKEYTKYGLKELVSIGIKLSDISGMKWFSSEIAMVKGPKDRSREFMVVDYLNDQCDMTPLSEAPNGVPDHVVKFIAKVIMSSVKDLLKNHKRDKERGYSVLLAPDMIKQIRS